MDDVKRFLEEKHKVSRKSFQIKIGVDITISSFLYAHGHTSLHEYCFYSGPF